MQVLMDFIGKDGNQGEIANYIANNGRLEPGLMRPYLADDGRAFVSVYKGTGDKTKEENYMTLQVNAGTLRRDEWVQLDQAILPIAQSRLVGIADLEAARLVFNLGNAMGTTVLEYHDVSDGFEVVMTMDGVTRSKGDRPEYSSKYLPIPIIHADYEINARVLEASRKLGNPLDTTSAELATRKVAEFLEGLLFTNRTYSFGNGVIYSYVNHPNRNELDLGTAWDDSSITGKAIVQKVLEAKAMSIADNHFGPWNLYIPAAYEMYMDEDYTDDKGETTIRERILKIEGINSVKVSTQLAADNPVLVQMTPDVVRLVKGFGIQNVEWQTEGKFITKYKVMTIQVPQIRADQDGKSGIVHIH